MNVIVDCVNISSIDDALYCRFYAEATAQRRARADRFLRREDAVRCVVAGALLRDALLRHGCDAAFAADPVIELGAQGKPTVLRVENFNYNLTHSGDWVAIAVAERPVGVDVEQIRVPLNEERARLSKRFFTDEERGYIFAGETDAERAVRWTRVWSMKESYLKYLGTGLAGALGTFSLCVAKDGTARVDGASPAQLWSMQPSDGYLLSVCLPFGSVQDVCPRQRTPKELLSSFA